MLPVCRPAQRGKAAHTHAKHLDIRPCSPQSNLACTPTPRHAPNPPQSIQIHPNPYKPRHHQHRTMLPQCCPKANPQCRAELGLQLARHFDNCTVVTAHNAAPSCRASIGPAGRPSGTVVNTCRSSAHGQPHIAHISTRLMPFSLHLPISSGLGLLGCSFVRLLPRPSAVAIISAFFLPYAPAVLREQARPLLGRLMGSDGLHLALSCRESPNRRLNRCLPNYCRLPWQMPLTKH